MKHNRLETISSLLILVCFYEITTMEPHTE